MGNGGFTMSKILLIICLLLSTLPAKALAQDPVSSSIVGGEVIFDAIYNMGEKVWKIVEKGKAVVNVKSKTASALPQGVTHWTQMRGWKVSSFKSGVTFTQPIGGTVIDLKYRITFTHSGSVNGVGRYIGYATVDPEVNAKWAAPKLDVSVTVPAIFNMGTVEQPIAGMKIDVHIRTKRFQTYETVDSYIITGSGKVHQL